MERYGFWVWKEKLLGVLKLLTDEAAASFDKQDYNAILYGISQTDSDSKKDFAYIFPSESDLTIQFMQDSDDSDIISLSVECKDETYKRFVEVLDRFQCYFTSWTLHEQEYFLEP